MIKRKQKLTAHVMSAILRDIMEQKGVSQADLVRMTGVNKSTVSQWCSGNVVLSDKSRKRLADTLGCDYNLLTYGVQTDQGGSAQPIAPGSSPVSVTANITGSTGVAVGATDQRHQVNMTEDEYFLWQLYRRIPDKKRGEVLRACQLRLMRAAGRLAEE